MIRLGLAVFAGLSVNLMLQFALGSGKAGKGNTLPLFQIINLFLTVIILWIFYTYIFNLLSREFVWYFLIFPFSALTSMGIERIEKHLFPMKKPVRLFSSLTAYEGLIPASLLLTVNMAVSFLDALILSFFFAFGCMIAIIFMKEIRRRSMLESIPKNLRGLPLAFISMGLLSMVFSAAAWICYRVLENF